MITDNRLSILYDAFCETIFDRVRRDDRIAGYQLIVQVIQDNGEFDPGSGRTLAACLTHVSQGESFTSVR